MTSMMSLPISVRQTSTTIPSDALHWWLSEKPSNWWSKALLIEFFRKENERPTPLAEQVSPQLKAPVSSYWSDYPTRDGRRKTLIAYEP
jgi:hypothetical protein